jgi:predicted Fe-S protein YdhL (DUF1289 family)
MKDQSAHCDINDEVIELHAMGRLQDATLPEHLDTCKDLRALRERRYSPNLKVFIYTPHQNKLPHLYAVASTGTRFALCGRPLDDTVPASQIQITQLRGRMCLGCQREAKEIFSRKTGLQTELLTRGRKLLPRRALNSKPTPLDKQQGLRSSTPSEGLE